VQTALRSFASARLVNLSGMARQPSVGQRRSVQQRWPSDRAAKSVAMVVSPSRVTLAFASSVKCQRGAA
jgi:hypothetical protein